MCGHLSIFKGVWESWSNEFKDEGDGEASDRRQRPETKEEKRKEDKEQGKKKKNNAASVLWQT